MFARQNFNSSNGYFGIGHQKVDKMEEESITGWRKKMVQDEKDVEIW
jgi:hypothetical protein